MSFKKATESVCRGRTTDARECFCMCCRQLVRLAISELATHSFIDSFKHAKPHPPSSPRAYCSAAALLINFRLFNSELRRNSIIVLLHAVHDCPPGGRTTDIELHVSQPLPFTFTCREGDHISGHPATSWAQCATPTDLHVSQQHFYFADIDNYSHCSGASETVEGALYTCI